MKPIICITGPTASGKSAWAVSLAKAHDGEIINADAMQVYRDLSILSARPTLDEMTGIPHHLFGHVDGAIRYSAGRWINDVEPLILDILARRKSPILVGGTGLYFKALLEGLADIPEPSPAAVSQAQTILDHSGISALREKAETLDPTATARVLGDDPQRLLRIVSVALGTDRPLSAWHMHTRPVLPRMLGGQPLWYGAVLLPEREKLYVRINARFNRMIDDGALTEVEQLWGRNLDPTLPVMKAIGVQHLREAISDSKKQDGSTDYGQAISLCKRDTRRFAKRQFTWFRGQMQDWSPIVGVNDRADFAAKISDR